MTKKIHLEILRIIAIIFVVFNHTSGFYLYGSQKYDSAQYWIYTFISIFIKCAVPIFLMISGGLLLAKEEGIKDTWKRVGRIALTLLVVSIFYYIHNRIVYKTPLNFKDFMTKFYMCKINTHLWYLYLYIGFLISLPLLRKFAKNLTTKEFIYMFCIAVIFINIIPSIDFLRWNNKITLNNNIKVTWIAGNMVLFPMVGYFIEHRLDMEKFRKKITAMWIVNIVCLIFTCFLTYKSMKLRGTAGMQTYISYFVIINAFSVYVTVKTLCDRYKIGNGVSRVIASIGSCTFGVYLFHIAIKDRPFMTKFTSNMIAAGMNRMLVYFIITLVIVVITTAIIWVVRKIPGFKKLL